MSLECHQTAESVELGNPPWQQSHAVIGHVLRPFSRHLFNIYAGVSYGVEWFSSPSVILEMHLRVCTGLLVEDLFGRRFMAAPGNRLGRMV